MEVECWKLIQLTYLQNLFLKLNNINISYLKVVQVIKNTKLYITKIMIDS